VIVGEGADHRDILGALLIQYLRLVIDQFAARPPSTQATIKHYTIL
jgi:hypothetical protein